jgi:hypothetical protein
MSSATFHAGYAPVAYSNLVTVETLTGARVVTFADGNVLKLDPGGSGRDVTLPAEAESAGLRYMIINAASGAEDLTVKDDAAATVGTVSQNEMAEFSCDGTTWTLLYIATIALS